MEAIHLEDREYSNVYAIPANYTDSGKLFGGMVDTRNAVEAVLLLAAAMPSALAADTRTGTVSAPTGILLLLASPGGEAAGEVPDGSAVSILSEETDVNGTLW